VSAASITRPVARAARGFSLIELLVAVAIIAVLSAVAAFPSSVDSATADLDLAEVQVRDAFATAQTIAYSLGEPCGVSFDTAHERFAVVRFNGDAAKDPLTHGDYEIDFRQIEQPRGVGISSAAFGATGGAGIFDGQGVPVSGGTVVLVKGDLVRTLTLDAATGKLVVGS
jgi:prepilin-type N-terminal cleavage/methylation domain-containing protein